MITQTGGGRLSDPPGPISIPLAGITAEFAKLGDVEIFRSVNGQKMRPLYNLKSIRREIYNDPEVFANDVVVVVVVVGDSQARRIFKDALQVAPTLLTPLVYILTTN